jgi:hypothetical protein
MMKSEVVNNRTLQLGDNEYESGNITLAAGAELNIGVVLKRLANNSFAPVVDTDPVEVDSEPVPGVPVDIPVAVNPAFIKNEGSGPANVGFRPLIKGRVRRDMLTINGAAITDAQADMLRNYGIIPVKGTDISREDNH